MYVLVAYDVVSNRRRNRLAKALKGYINRVQKSVFEGEIPEHRFQMLVETIEKEIDREQDSVRVYRLCRRCIQAVDVIGLGVYTEDEEDEIV